MKHSTLRGLVVSTVLTAFPFSAAHAEHPGLPTELEVHEGKLLGNMWGLRDNLAEHGVDLTIEYKADAWWVTDGGIKTGRNYLDNLDIRFDIDGEKLFGIEGNTAAVHFTNNAGGKTNTTRIGSATGIDNVEVTKSAPILYELWDEQEFGANKQWSVRIGIMDMNNEFQYTEAGLNFLSPTQQLSQTIAQAGKNGPISFPYTEPGVRVRYKPTEESYIQAAVYNGLAGDPDHLYGTHIKFDGNLFMVAEAGLKPKPAADVDWSPNLFALGAWTYTHSFNDLEVSGKRERSYGFYMLNSWQFFHDDEGRQITGFFRPNMADGDTRQVEYGYEIGVMSTGLVAARPDAEIGLAMSQLFNGEKYIRSEVANGNNPRHHEYAFEAYYMDEVYPGVTLQPDIQYIIHPGSVVGRQNATVLGLRTYLAF